MTRPRSLRRLMVVGSVAFVVGAGVVLAGIDLLFTSLRHEFEHDLSSSVVEQRAADEIVTTVYGQLFATYRRLGNPSAGSSERFDSLGQVAYTRLRQYLFQPMALEQRMQVETIMELHEALEVEAHRAFDFVGSGQASAARVHIDEMESRASRLETEMDRFVALRALERARRRDVQTSILQGWVAGLAVLVVVLAVLAVLFLRAMMRSVLRPLAQFSEAAVRLSKGDRSARVPPQRHDELETVALSFNEMAATKQAAMVEIEAQNRQLIDALRDLHAAQESLVQQAKMGAIGVMTAGLAHELNNPLAGILGAGQIIEDELSGHADPAVRRTVEQMVRPLVAEAQRAGDLVRNLLEFSRKSSTDLQIVNLKTAIDVAAGLRAFAFKQAGKILQVSVPEGLNVEGDAQRLEQTAMNIMSNALDAMRGGTGTTLRVQAAPAEAGWVNLTFIDDGPGFRDPELVFDPFYTTKAIGVGTGLGLSLVQRFVTEAGGTVQATNDAESGARITIRLRSAAVPSCGSTNSSDKESHTASRTGPAALASMAVLVVDDEPALRAIQKRHLEKLGVRVHVAANGAEAKAILLRERCDVVVTDLRMPGEIDGIALYHWIEETQPELAERCLFVSGNLADWEEGSVLAAHPERFIAKPFTRDDYLARIRALLDLQRV